MLMRASGNRNKLDAERGRHKEEVEELGEDVNMLAMKLRQREDKLEPLRANASSYISNILVQESGQGDGGNVDNILDALLIRAAGNRNKLITERDRHREVVEELGRNVNAPAMKLRPREEELESLRANASSYIGNILAQEARQGGGKVNDIFDATLMRASSNRNKLDAERGRHREEVEELGGDINMLATKLRQREDKLEPLRANASSYIGNILVQESGQGGGKDVDNIFGATLI
jgi:chromosome segregation ATPase